MTKFPKFYLIIDDVAWLPRFFHWGETWQARPRQWWVRRFGWSNNSLVGLRDWLIKISVNGD